ncbi:urease accessory protein UreH domain-containing protein [Desulfosporosinus fructosivorans]
MVSLLIMFGVGFVLSFKRMGVMAPLIIGGSRQSGYSRSFLFMGGYTLTLMFLGLLAARLGNVLTLPGWFWTLFLGILYLIIGLVLLRERLPITVIGFNVTRDRSHWLGLFANKQGLNPMVLGIVFALVPSPMIMAISVFALASGQMLFGSLALGFFGLGHSLPLSFAFVPWVRSLFRPNRFTHGLRPALGMLLVVLALYLLLAQPDFFDPSSMASHAK